MLKFEKFTGINNVLPTERLGNSELAVAENVDIASDGQVLLRQGYTLYVAGCHRNLWEGPRFTLATLTHGELAAIVGTTETEVHPSMGPDRVWYTALPDGTAVFSNGLIGGITDGATSQPIGVPLPDRAGAFTSVPGSLHPGVYQWALTHIRASDGTESGTTFGGTAEVTDGGILLTGLAVRDGYQTSVYLTGANGDVFFHAGNTSGPAFSFTAANDTLVIPCRTHLMTPMPAGKLFAFWRGRLLCAVGNLLLASRADQWELHNPAKDFKQFADPITLIQPVSDGVYVGTESELVFLSGTDFDSLAFMRSIPGRVVLGSGVSIPGKKIGRGQSMGSGDAMMCIVDGKIAAGFASGSVDLITEDRYEVDPAITEVFATFREVRGISQYLATPT